MRNLFYYTRREPSPIKIEGKEQEFKTYRDCFSVSKVIRAVEEEDGRLLVLLDDIHQRPQSVEVRNKQGKVTSIKREMQTFQSEIHLESSDAARFYKLTNIEQL